MINFKEAFEEEAGLSWEESREDIFYEEDAIVEALVKNKKYIGRCCS